MVQRRGGRGSMRHQADFACYGRGAGTANVRPPVCPGAPVRVPPGSTVVVRVPYAPAPSTGRSMTLLAATAAGSAAAPSSPWVASHAARSPSLSSSEVQNFIGS